VRQAAAGAVECRVFFRTGTRIMERPHANPNATPSAAASTGRYVARWVDWTALAVLAALALLTAVVHL
jgi:hypothetical protein